MKIKCPYCAEEYDKSGLENHFDNYPHHATESYIELLFKIHEKIEEREKEIEYLQNKDTLYISPLRRNEEEIRILKSLLENEN